MSGSLSNADRAEPNLTPVLDMVFQLITFFMLVINFKSASMDLALHLPTVGSVRPVNIKHQDLLILNIDQKGTLRVYGIERKDIAGYIAQEAQSSLLAARKYKPDIKVGDDLPVTVIVRADKKTPFRLLYNVIIACQENGFRNFSLRALTRVEK
jgi:biopolymer transport protein ExbD